MGSGKTPSQVALDAIPLPAALFGPGLAYLGGNRAFSAFFSALSETAPGEGGRSPLAFFDIRLPFSLSAHLYAFASGKSAPDAVENGLNGVDGKYRWLRFRLGRLAMEGGDQGILCLVEDLSAQKAREEELATAKEEAEREMAMRSRLIANMSHEIRTPIQTIIGMVELLGDTKLDHEQEEYLRQASFSADVLLSLVNDILDYSKIEAGKLVLETIDFDLRDCIERSSDMIALDAHRKGLELVLDLSSGLPTLVRGDPTRVRQILVNLIKNAVKFTAAGEVLVRAFLRTDELGREMIRVEVADTGIGLTPEVKAKLFTSFYQADSSHTRKYGGTGLGLSISKHLVERMGGEIGVADAPSGGSVFFFEIPAQRPSFSLPDESTRLSGRILVVDDLESARKAETAMAASFGLGADGASSGQEALAMLESAAAAGAPYELCAVDQNMPAMDGWRLAAEISGRESINAAKLILLSPEGSLGADAKMKLLNWFNGYVDKPVKSRDFREALARASGYAIDLEAAESADRDGETTPTLGGARVLVAEDHPVNQALFRVILERSGCDVQVASDGQEAVELNAQRPFDIVFMDIQMPRLDGFEATRSIRGSGGRMPIVAVTANSAREERAKCLECGMNDILVKPFRKKDIDMMLSFWLKHGIPEAARDQEPPETRPSPPALSFSDADVLNFPELIATFLGDEGAVAGILSKFIARTKESVRAIDAALEKGSWEEISREAHAVKGSALNLCARRLGRAGEALERAAKARDAKELEEAVELLREEFFEFAQYAQYYVTKIG